MLMLQQNAPVTPTTRDLEQQAGMKLTEDNLVLESGLMDTLISWC